MNPLKRLAHPLIAVGVRLLDWVDARLDRRIAAATADLRCPFCHSDTCYGWACQPHGRDDWKRP